MPGWAVRETICHNNNQPAIPQRLYTQKRKIYIYLPTPTHPQTRPLLDSTIFLPNLLHQFWYLLRIILRIRRPPKERPEPLLLLLRIRGIILVAQGLAEEEIRHEDLVLVGRVGMSKNISTLESLIAKTEDIIDDEDGGGGVGGTRGVYEAGGVSGGSWSCGWGQWKGGKTNSISCHRSDQCISPWDYTPSKQRAVHYNTPAQTQNVNHCITNPNPIIYTPPKTYLTMTLCSLHTHFRYIPS